MNYLIPVLLIITFIIALIKKVSLFDSFTLGAKEAIALVINILPYLAAMFIAVELMRESGLSVLLAKVLSPLFRLLGIPIELSELIILRPLTGSGSLVVLENIYTQYGVDSYPARVASVLMGSTDTVLYIVAVYFSSSKDKRSGASIPISLAVSFIGTILACVLCRFM